MQLSFRSFTVTALAAAGLTLVGSTLISSPAKADSWDKLTYVTLNDRLIAGNIVLEPGTYVWKLLDSQSDRHIVQIFNKDQTHLEETILAIPNYRLQPTGNTRFAFYETPAGVPKAVRAWFYPGDNFGQEFKYPTKLVAQLASALPTPIPMTYREPEPAVTPEAQPKAQPTPAPQPATAEATPEPTPQPAPAAEPAPATNTVTAALPHTASNTPLIGLLGIASLGIAGALSLATKRS